MYDIGDIRGHTWYGVTPASKYSNSTHSKAAEKERDGTLSKSPALWYSRRPTKQQRFPNKQFHAINSCVPTAVPKYNQNKFQQSIDEERAVRDVR